MGRLGSDREGQVFGRLTVVEYRDNKNTLVLCECGSEKVVRWDNLKSGKTTSCGCYFRESKTRHGMDWHPLSSVWRAMRSRCYSKGSQDYRNYGARGITVCNEWRDNLAGFIKWSEANGYRKGLSIDRVNNDGPYSPGNCRWVTSQVQNNNQRRRATSRFKGVGWYASRSKWRTACGGKFVGYYDTALEAAIAYDRVSADLFGIEAALNFAPAGRKRDTRGYPSQVDFDAAVPSEILKVNKNTTRARSSAG